MLIRYSVENFLSFRLRTEFSMIPGKGSLKKWHRTEPLNGVQTLRAGIILGANASGKSNLIKAMAFGQGLVIKGVSSDQLFDYQKYKLDSAYASRDSRMEYEIQSGGKNYAYGFVFNHKSIVEEWLYEISRRGDKKIFERNANTPDKFDLAPLLALNSKEEDRQFLKFSAKGTPDNQLFLREMIIRKGADNVADISDLSAVYDWFMNTLKVIFPEDKYKRGIESEIVGDERLHTVYEEFLKYFGTGISGICMEDVTPENVKLPDIITDRIKERLLNSKTEGVRSIIGLNGNSYFFTREGDGIRIQKFMTRHDVKGGGKILFDTKDESDGTNRIIDIIPLIIDLIEGENVFVIDEMERSLHPNLIYDIVDLFLDPATHSKGQLIIATHESSLLTQKLFRKDEIWFVVKNDEGASQLHSLEDYNVRFDKEIRKDYLLGRFKAIPRIGNRYGLPIKTFHDA